MVKFRESQQRACDEFIHHELNRRGASPHLVDSLLDHVRHISAERDDDSNDPGSMGIVFVRMCWVIRQEDLDVVCTLARYAPAMIGAGASMAFVPGVAVAVPIATGVAAGIAFMVTVWENARRKGVTLPLMAIGTLLVLKQRPDGSSTEEVAQALELALGGSTSLADVNELLAALANAKANASGAPVALAFERNGRWFSAA